MNIRTASLIVSVACLVGVPAWFMAAESPSKGNVPFQYDAKGRRDPFVPLVRDGQLVSVSQRPSVDASTPTLHGILWDPGGHSLALINDVEAKVGDAVGEYRVTEIRNDAVVLSNGGAPMVLQISFETPSETASSDGTTGGAGE